MSIVCEIYMTASSFLVTVSWFHPASFLFCPVSHQVVIVFINACLCVLFGEQFFVMKCYFFPQGYILVNFLWFVDITSSVFNSGCNSCFHIVHYIMLNLNSTVELYFHKRLSPNYHNCVFPTDTSLTHTLRTLKLHYLHNLRTRKTTSIFTERWEISWQECFVCRYNIFLQRLLVWSHF